MGCNECWPWPNWPLLISSALYLLSARRGVWFQRSSWWENERERERDNWVIMWFITVNNVVVSVGHTDLSVSYFTLWCILLFCFLNSLKLLVMQWFKKKKKSMRLTNITPVTSFQHIQLCPTCTSLVISPISIRIMFFCDYFLLWLRDNIWQKIVRRKWRDGIGKWTKTNWISGLPHIL